MNLRHYANKLVTKLNKRGLRAYVYYKARTGSVYVKFRDNYFGSIRIADHDGYDKYSYMYNIREDIEKSYSEYDGTTLRYYFNPNDYSKIYNTIISVKRERDRRNK